MEQFYLMKTFKIVSFQLGQRKVLDQLLNEQIFKMRFDPFLKRQTMLEATSYVAFNCVLVIRTRKGYLSIM